MYSRTHGTTAREDPNPILDKANMFITHASYALRHILIIVMCVYNSHDDRAQYPYSYG